MYKKFGLVAALLMGTAFAGDALQLELLWKDGQVSLLSKKEITAQLKKERGNSEDVQNKEFSWSLKDRSNHTLLEKALRHPAVLHLDIPENTSGHSPNHQEILQDSTVFTLIIPLDNALEARLEFWQNLRSQEQLSSPNTGFSPVPLAEPTPQKVGDIAL
jgi:hypothetical protein